MGYRISLPYLILSFVLLQETVSAVELAGSLGPGSTDTVNPYNYRAYDFSPTPGVKFYIVLRSTKFDPYLMIIRPDGSVLTNDTHNIVGVVNSSGRDAGIAVEYPAAGRWTAVVTTSDIYVGREGDYVIEYGGISGLGTIDFASSEHSKSISSAFAARGIVDPMARRDALVEHLTLRSFRAEVRRRAQKEMVSLEVKNAKLRKEISALDDNHVELSKALANVDNLTESKALVQDLLRRKLKETHDSREKYSDDLVTTLSNYDALTAALRELDLLDAVADELAKREELLLGPILPDDATAIRAAIIRLRGEREVLGGAIAEKLLASRIIQGLRGFGFRILGSNWLFWPDIVWVPEKDVAYDVAYDANTTSFLASRTKVGDDLVIDTSVWLPAMLPWPPPDPSSRVVVERRFLAKQNAPLSTLGDLDDRLQKALSGAGYSGCSYWGVPGGFAIVTPLEQTNDGGTPLDGSARWAASIVEIKAFSLTAYLKALLTAPAGYFRVLALVTSADPFAPSGSRAQLATIERWSRRGLNFLPDAIRAEAFTDGHRLTVLVYEFMKRTDTDKPEASVPGRLPATDHLKATKLTILLP